MANDKATNVLEEYGNRLIDDIDRDLLRNAIEEGPNHVWMSSSQKGIIYSPSDGVHVSLSCISKYFVPKKTYWKISSKDSCNKICRAYFGNARANDCVQCFKTCLDSKLKIKESAKEKKRRLGDTDD